jgi:lipoate-protein ligase A
MDYEAFRADDALFAATRDDGQPRVAIYRPDSIQVVLGRGSKPELEIHAERCRADGIQVLRRRGGGCTVLLDPGDVIVSVCLHAPGIGENKRWFSFINERLLGALVDLGAKGLRQAGISDLALGEKKVAGCSLHRSRDTLYYSASLLVDPRIELMQRYLKHPPREPDYRKGRTHEQFVTSLKSLLGDPDRVEEGLSSLLAAETWIGMPRPLPNRPRGS